MDEIITTLNLPDGMCRGNYDSLHAMRARKVAALEANATEVTNETTE